MRRCEGDSECPLPARVPVADSRPPATRKASDSFQHPTQCLRGKTSHGVPEAEAPAAAPETRETPPEPDGDGTLCPTLVIGLGGLGCAVFAVVPRRCCRALRHG